jgi:formate dehydrogenase
MTYQIPPHLFIIDRTQKIWAIPATRKKIAEITGSNVVSVAEQVVLNILALVRNYIPAYKQVLDGRWDIAEIAAKAHDLEDKIVEILGMGRIGQRVCERLKAFNVKMLYYDQFPLHTVEEYVLGARFASKEQLVEHSDVITINTPLTPKTDAMFDRNLIFSMKKGAYLVNTARGKIVDTTSLVEALEVGQLAGYAGDVWYPQPASKDHPWRHMPNHAMVSHYSRTTLKAQARYSNGIRDCLSRFLENRPP